MFRNSSGQCCSCKCQERETENHTPLSFAKQCGTLVSPGKISEILEAFDLLLILVFTPGGVRNVTLKNFFHIIREECKRSYLLELW